MPTPRLLQRRCRAYRERRPQDCRRRKQGHGRERSAQFGRAQHLGKNSRSCVVAVEYVQGYPAAPVCPQGGGNRRVTQRPVGAQQGDIPGCEVGQYLRVLLHGLLVVLACHAPCGGEIDKHGRPLASSCSARPGAQFCQALSLTDIACGGRTVLIWLASNQANPAAHATAITPTMTRARPVKPRPQTSMLVATKTASRALAASIPV